MREEQLEELQALRDILDEHEFSLVESADESQPLGGQLSVCPDLPAAGLQLLMPASAAAKVNASKLPVPTPDDPGTAAVAVQFLPAIVINFQLPPNYPEILPQFTISCPYLPPTQLLQLYKALALAFEPGQPVLYTWAMFLKEEALKTCGVSGALRLRVPHVARKSTSELQPASPAAAGPVSQISAAPAPQPAGAAATVSEFLSSKSLSAVDRQLVSQDVSDVVRLAELLISYNDDKEQARFKQALHTCTICFEEKPGSECYRLQRCNHVTCRNCLSGYFESQIASGDPRSLRCPEPECTNEALPSDVKELVSKEAFARYDDLLMKKCLSEMRDVVYCVRKACQAPVIVEDGNKMGFCHRCGFCFCIWCEQTYHGVRPCNIANMVAVLKDYREGDATTREFLEKKYGVERMRDMVANSASMELIEQTTKACPSCKSKISKLSGCNKMHCTFCNSFFCWLCGRVLDPRNPYSHFNAVNADRGCGGRLFDGIEDADNLDGEGNEAMDELLGLFDDLIRLAPGAAGVG